MKHKQKKENDEHSGDNIVEQKGEIGEPTSEIIAMTRQLLELETRYEEVKKDAAKLYEEKVKTELQLYDRMKDVGINQFRTSEFGLISCANTLYGTITDLDAASKWLKEKGLFNEILKYAPKKARVNELLKKCLEDGKPIPPGFDYSLTKSISVRRV